MSTYMHVYIYCLHVYICMYVKRNAHMTCGRHVSTLALSCCISLYSQLIGSRGLCSYHFVIVTLHVKTQHYISTYIHSLIFTYTCNNIHTLVKMYIVNNLTTCAAGKHVSIDCSRTVVPPYPLSLLQYHSPFLSVYCGLYLFAKCSVQNNLRHLQGESKKLNWVIIICI